MSGHALAGAAALPGVGSGKYDRARMSKVHDELWEKSDAAKVLIDTASRRAKDLSTSQLTFFPPPQLAITVRTYIRLN